MEYLRFIYEHWILTTWFLVLILRLRLFSFHFDRKA